jgi:hypothetical protein
MSFSAAGDGAGAAHLKAMVFFVVYTHGKGDGSLYAIKRCRM